MIKMNQSKPVEKKKNSNFAMAVISLILAAVLLVVDLYLLINMPSNFIGLLGTTLLMIVWVYFFVKSLFMEMKNNKKETDTYLEAIIKSEKAFFLMQRKMENELQQISEYSKMPSEEIIKAQKAIAKVTINRSKENTDALMNSNDQVMDKLANFEAALTEINDQIIEKQKDLMDSSQRDIIMKQQEIVTNMREMESSIKNEMSKAFDSINAMQSRAYMETSESDFADTQMSPEPMAEIMPEEAEPDYQSDELPDFRMAEEMLSADIGIGDIEEEMTLPDLGINEEEEIDEIGIGGEEEIELPDLGIGGEASSDNMEMSKEPESIPEPEEKPSMPDLSDPSKLMTPEEIAALIANL